MASKLNSNNPTVIEQVGFCPLLSGIYKDSAIVEGEVILKKVDCIGIKCKLWVVEMSACSIIIEAYTKVHEHQAHWHKSKHKVTDGFDMLQGEPFVKIPKSKADELMKEFAFNTDLDGNGKVYGYDFIIDPEDPNMPPVLETLKNLIKIDDIPEVITWEEFLTL